MIWAILYILVAAAAVFGLCYARMRCFKFGRYDDLIAPVICGIFWPVCGVIYGAYLAARWYAEKE